MRTRTAILVATLLVLLAAGRLPAAPAAPAATAVPAAATPAPPASPLADWIKFDPAKVGGREWRAEIVSAAPDRKILRLVAAKPNGKKIMALVDGQAGWADTSLKTILAVFSDKGFFPTITLVNYQKDAAQLDAALAMLAPDGYDLVVTLGSTALANSHKKLKGRKIPVVTACNKDPVLLGYIKDYQSGSGSNIAFSSVNTPIEVQLTFLRKLVSGIRAVAILVDRSNKSAMETQYKPFKEALQKEGVSVIDVVVGPEDDKDPKLLEVVKAGLTAQVPAALEALKAADTEGGKSVFWLTYCTSIVKNLETLNQFSGTVPVVGVATDTVLEGDNSTVIGIGVSFESNAYVSAMYAMNILNGKAVAGNLPVGLTSPPDIAINFRRARAIGMKIPFSFFESANIVYDADGAKVRDKGIKVSSR